MAVVTADHLVEAGVNGPETLVLPVEAPFHLALMKSMSSWVSVMGLRPDRGAGGPSIAAV